MCPQGRNNKRGGASLGPAASAEALQGEQAMKAELSDLTATIERARDEADGAHRAADTNTRLAWLRTQLAVERTLMAWNRTALALIGFGFTIYQFLGRVQEANPEMGILRPEAPRNFGLAFLLAGTLGTLIALWQHHLYTKYLRRRELDDVAIQEGMPHVSLPLVITVFLALIGIVTTIWVLVGN
jgi:putative membrane protein